MREEGPQQQADQHLFLSTKPVTSISHLELYVNFVLSKVPLCYLSPESCSLLIIAHTYSSQGVLGVMPCSVAVGYQHFRGPCCLQLRDEVHSEILVSYHNTTQHHNIEYLNSNLHCHENLESCNPHVG